MSRAADVLIGALHEGRRVPEILAPFRALVQEGVLHFNKTYSARTLIRLSTEVVPNHPRDVTAVRGRMGTLLELGLAQMWNEFLATAADPEWRVTVNYVTEYPDLYLRNERGDIALRIETKALHDEADEGAARFDTLTPLIDESLDVLVVVGWQWKHARPSAAQVSYPFIFAADAFSAMEVARERDTRFRITGGVFRSGGRPFVRPKKARRKYKADPGNYGKLNRIVHRTRPWDALSEEVRRLITLLSEIFPGRRRPG